VVFSVFRAPEGSALLASLSSLRISHTGFSVVGRMHVRFYGFDFSVASLVFGCCCRRCGDALPLPLPLRLSLFASSLLYRRNTTNHHHYDNQSLRQQQQDRTPAISLSLSSTCCCCCRDCLSWIPIFGGCILVEDITTDRDTLQPQPQPQPQHTDLPRGSRSTTTTTTISPINISLKQ